MKKINNLTDFKVVNTDSPVLICKYEKLDLKPDTFILNLNTIKVGQDEKQESFDLIKLFKNIDSLSKNKFEIFLEVVEECGIKTGDEFAHFISVIQEHCIDKGITDYEEVKKIWEEHKESIKQIVENSKKSDIIGTFTDKDGNKTPIMKMAGLFSEDIDKYPDDL